MIETECLLWMMSHTSIMPFTVASHQGAISWFCFGSPTWNFAAVALTATLPSAVWLLSHLSSEDAAALWKRQITFTNCGQKIIHCQRKCILSVNFFFLAFICGFAVVPAGGCLLCNGTLTQMSGDGAACLFLFDSSAVRGLSACICAAE